MGKHLFLELRLLLLRNTVFRVWGDEERAGILQDVVMFRQAKHSTPVGRWAGYSTSLAKEYNQCRLLQMYCLVQISYL